MDTQLREFASSIEALAQVLNGRSVRPNDLHTIEAFQASVSRAVACDPLDAKRESEGRASVRHLDGAWALAAFLTRSGFLGHAGARRPVNAVEVAESFLRETARQDVQIKKLVIIDGLDGEECDFGTARLIKIDKAYFSEFCEGEPVDGEIKVEDLDGMYGIEMVVSSASNPSWTNFSLYFDTTTHRIRRTISPWLTYFNLWSESGQLVRAIALYERSDSLVTWPPARSFVISQPTMQPVLYEEDDHEVWAPHHTVTVNEGSSLVAFVKELEAGRRAASPKSHRAETALRFYARACEGLWVTDEMSAEDPELTEDVVIGLISCLESIYLPENAGRRKGQNIASRAAALCGNSDAERRRIRRELTDAYQLRSDIVHGDVPPSHKQLKEATKTLQPIARDSLVAFLRLNGDQNALIAACRGDRRP